MNTVIDFGIKVWGDKFTDGFDQDGWGQGDRQAKLANMVMALDKVNLATASRRAKQVIRYLDGNVQKACDVIRAELVRHHVEPRKNQPPHNAPTKMIALKSTTTKNINQETKPAHIKSGTRKLTP